MSENSNFNNPNHLKTDQYKTSSNLSARIRLHQDYSTTDESPISGTFDLMLEYIPENAKILELGTGRGDLWKENTHRIPDGWDMTLTDLSAGMIDDQKAYLGDLSERMTYDVVNAIDIPYADNSFDVIVANYMLYHVPDRAKAIAEIRRVLKADGVLFAATNGENHMTRIFDIAREVNEIVGERGFSAWTFSLQNGITQLTKQFTDIRMIRFNNNLWIPEAQPIIDYIASMVSFDGEAIVRQHETEIKDKLNRLIAENGGILIEKETGIFIARGAYDRETQSGN